jgi:transposase-like protein
VLKDLIGENKLKLYICDFECTVFKPINENFPHAEIGTCLFHFAQNIFRKIGTLGYINKNKNDYNFRLMLKCLNSLTFVPISKMYEEFF